MTPDVILRGYPAEIRIDIQMVIKKHVSDVIIGNNHRHVWCDTLRKTIYI